MPRFEFDPAVSQVWVDGTSSIHPISATATGVTGWLQISTTRAGVAAAPKLAAEIRIAVDRLQSGNPLVDRETRRRVDAKRFPEIVGTATASKRVDTNRVSVTGDIAFRGEVRSVTGEVTAHLDGDDITIDGEARLDVRDWGLEPPRIALLKVHPDVTVRIHLVGSRAR